MTCSTLQSFQFSHLQDGGNSLKCLFVQAVYIRIGHILYKKPAWASRQKGGYLTGKLRPQRNRSNCGLSEHWKGAPEYAITLHGDQGQGISRPQERLTLAMGCCQELIQCSLHISWLFLSVNLHHLSPLCWHLICSRLLARNGITRLSKVAAPCPGTGRFPPDFCWSQFPVTRKEFWLVQLKVEWYQACTDLMRLGQRVILYRMTPVGDLLLLIWVGLRGTSDLEGLPPKYSLPFVRIYELTQYLERNRHWIKITKNILVNKSF